MNVLAKTGLGLFVATGAFFFLFVAGGVIQQSAQEKPAQQTDAERPGDKIVYVNRGLGFWDYMILDAMFSSHSHCEDCKSKKSKSDDLVAFLFALLLAAVLVIYVLPVVAKLVYAYPEYAFVVLMACAVGYVVYDWYNARKAGNSVPERPVESLKED